MAFKSFMIVSVEEIASTLYNTSSTNNILKWFLKDNSGIPLTHCPCQNPLCSPPFLLLILLLIPLLLLHPRLQILQWKHMRPITSLSLGNVDSPTNVVGTLDG